jgi:hypothetical protein
MKTEQLDEFIYNWFMISNVILLIGSMGYFFFKYPPVSFIITGIWFSFGLGTFVLNRFLNWLRKDIKVVFGERARNELKAGERIPELESEDDRQKPWLDIVVGVIERFIFTVLSAISLKSAIVPMAGWLALKLATSWHKRKDDTRPYIQLLIRSLSLSALLAGFLSLFFAFVGGALIGIGIKMINCNFMQIFNL